MLNPGQILGRYEAFVRSNPEYRTSIDLSYLPLQRYRVYEKWKPDEVRVLFIAESPPWRKESVYFYNPERIGGLSEAVFKHLKFNEGSKKARLREFKRGRLFLTDTVKCVINKSRVKSIPRTLIRFSTREILQKEIETLQPSTIFALGNTALHGLKAIDRYSGVLSPYDSITAASGKSVRADNTTIVLCVFPNDRNKRYEKSIRSAFRMVG